MDDILVEVSGHRGLGRIYLTDFRLIILCTDATSTNLAKTSVCQAPSLLTLYIAKDKSIKYKEKQYSFIFSLALYTALIKFSEWGKKD